MIHLLDWPASVVLIAGYFTLAKRPRPGTLLLFAADVLWSTFAIATGQLPLLAVSVICGLLSLRTWLTWRPA